jgi:PAS domain S-box-containing protein
LVLFFVLYRLVLKPFEVLNSDIDKVLKGELEQVTRPFRFSEMNQLWDVIGSALQRIPRSKADVDGVGLSAGEDGSAEPYLGMALGLSRLQSLAVALLNGQGEIQYLNSVFEELTGLRSDNVVGQNLVSVARDQAFGSFISDGLERTFTGMEGVSEEFEFSGVAYRVYFSAFGVSGSKPRSYLIYAVKSET